MQTLIITSRDSKFLHKMFEWLMSQPKHGNYTSIALSTDTSDSEIEELHNVNVRLTVKTIKLQEALEEAREIIKELENYGRRN